MAKFLKSHEMSFVLQNTCVIYSNKKLRKGLISYYKTNGISTLKKHVDALEHGLLAKKPNEEMNSLVRI